MKLSDETKERLSDVGYALGYTLYQHALDFLITGLIMRPLSKTIAATTRPERFTGASRLLTARALSKIAPDGAYLDGPAPQGFAKFAIRKGLPLDKNGKTMAVENPPHTVDDFDGEIKEGYGKGTKKLAWSGKAVIKVGEKVHIGKVNIHEHLADRAGKHFDFVAEGVAPGTRQFEVNIPAGAYKGRYAFVSTDKLGDNYRLITRMKDRSVLLPKPTFNLKDKEFLQNLDKLPSSQDFIVEWKADGSLANVAIHNNRAVFRSHRETGSSYYDQLPALEWLKNNSRLFSNRFFFPGPDQEGTVLKGELFHDDGASRVSGILNALPENAIRIQKERGPVKFYAWDLVKYKGKDISNYEYQERRRMLESVISDIRRFNRAWDCVPVVTSEFTSFYNEIVSEPRGLPFSEGVVVKSRHSKIGDPWFKIKARESVDVRVAGIYEGIGKRAGTVGRMLVETADGKRSYVGSFNTSDAQLKWIWDHRDMLIGDTAELTVQEQTANSLRAPTFYRWHPSKSTAGVLMYSESLAGTTNIKEAKPMLYALKSSAGWKRK